MTELIKTHRFLMNAPFAKSSWKKWQQTLFAEARKYDNQIFTGAGMEHLCDLLVYLGGKCRGEVEIRRPDWEMFLEYGTNPSINLGEGCYIPFIPITGEYYDN